VNTRQRRIASYLAAVAVADLRDRSYVPTGYVDSLTDGAMYAIVVRDRVAREQAARHASVHDRTASCTDGSGCRNVATVGKFCRTHAAMRAAR